MISKNKKTCNTYLQKMKFLKLSSLLCPAPGVKSSLNTRWFKYDRDWFVCTFVQISPGHIWTTLYVYTWVQIKLIHSYNM